MLIDELKILARGTFVLDKDGKVVYAEKVKEVAQEPNYEAALQALRGSCSRNERRESAALRLNAARQRLGLLTLN